jgi:phosphoglycolate phosphatase-like HAD superfamily hydrolase
MINLSRTSLFVFDFDGTLVQSNSIKRAVFYEVTSGIPAAHKELDLLFKTMPHLDRYGIFRELAHRIGGVDENALALAYTSLCAERILASPEVPGVSDLLTVLKARGRTTVVNSSTPEKPLKELVPDCAFGPNIDAIYGEPASKLENLQKAMTRYGAKTGETVIVGDGEGDRMCAVRAGCLFVAVESDLNDFAMRPVVIIKRLDELIHWL